MFSPSSKSPTLKLAICRTSSIGDVVLATACIDLLEHLKMPVEITWLGKSFTNTFLQHSYPGIKFLDVGRASDAAQMSRLIEKLADVHLFIDLQLSIKSHLIGIQLARRFGVPVFKSRKMQVFRNRLLLEARVRGRRRALPEASLKPPEKQYRLMVAALKEALTCHLPPDLLDDVLHYDAQTRLNVKEDHKAKPWLQEVRFGRWLAVAPGATHLTKQAPLTLFAKVLSELDSSLKGQDFIGLVFLGDSKERPLALELSSLINWSGPQLNLSGRLSLWESAQVLHKAKLLLCNDSGLGHIAEAVGTPTAVLFGPTIEGFGFAPRLPESRSFSSTLGCRPCSKHGKAPCRYKDQKCFTDLDSAGIAAFLQERLRCTSQKDVPLFSQDLKTSQKRENGSSIQA